MESSGNRKLRSTIGRFTALGLFEDTLDMEKALVAIRRAGRPPEEISLVLRDRTAEGSGDGKGAVPRAVSDHTLDAVGGWLVGLAELVLPDGSTFLVSGPVGVAFAEVRKRQQSGASQAVAVHDHELSESVLPLAETLAYFGFSPEESHYLAHRLSAGDAIVAHTTTEPDTLRATRRLFADCDAVHIGQAQTDEEVFREAQRYLARPAKSASDIVVADAVDPFLNLCGLDRPPKWVKSLCGAQIVDESGTEVGAIDGLLAMPVEEPNDEKLQQAMRYVVVRHGRVLKLGRRRVAVPSDLVDLERDPPVVNARASVIHRAPAYDPDSPFSRREEEAVFDHFGAQPYWKSRRAANAAPA